jgi:hypothetical protein
MAEESLVDSSIASSTVSGNMARLKHETVLNGNDNLAFAAKFAAACLS